MSTFLLGVGSSLLSPAMGAITLTADSFWIYRTSSFNVTTPGAAASPQSIVPGASGVGSRVDSSNSAGSLNYDISAAAVQEYLIFHARASSHAERINPSNSFETFQAFATGSLTETLTIPAPPGVPSGSVGKLMLGWDVTGNRSNGVDGTAYMAIVARTSASLPQTSSNTVSIEGDGHFELVAPISFLFDTPFQLTIDSSVFAGVGYDYSIVPPPPVFNDTASAEFLHTAALTSALVSDAAGTPYPAATITTSSGMPFPLSPPPTCGGDANGDNLVNFDDITAAISNWGATYAPGAGGLGDANNDGVVDFDDINAVLSNWAAACP